MNAWIFSSLNYSRIRLPSLKAIILLTGLALIIEGHRIIYHTNPNNKDYNHPTLLSFLFVPNQNGFVCLSYISTIIFVIESSGHRW